MVRLEDECWIGVYLYYSPPYEGFLTNAVAPFVKSLLTSEKILSFFFIRYMEKGPHLRLRLKVNKKYKLEVEKEVEVYFSNWFNNHPSERVDSDSSWHDNNSFVFSTYEPETTRYGGEQGIIISEKIFNLSSKVILQILEHETYWNYSKALSAAIQLHLTFAHAARMDHNQMVSFFSYINREWFYTLFTDHKMTERELLLSKEKIVKAFLQTYDVIRLNMVPFVRDFILELPQLNAEQNYWLSEWQNELNALFCQLTSLDESGKLLSTVHYESNNQMEKTYKLWNIYSSYIHMTNNRLGILNRDESYLGYILQKSLLDTAA